MASEQTQFHLSVNEYRETYALRERERIDNMVPREQMLQNFKLMGKSPARTAQESATDALITKIGMCMDSENLFISTFSQ